MRKLFTLLFVLSTAVSVNAQSLTSPESVEFDAANDRYLISNSNDGTIVTRDQAGVIGSFVSGIPSGPLGLEILGNVVYACTGGRVRGYDLDTHAEVFNVNCGGSFLNGITTDGTFIYVTDFGSAKIFKVDVNAATSSTFVANTNGTPNGIVFDPETDAGVLWVAFWGSNAPVKTFTLDGTLGTTITTTLSNIDGITRDCFGNLYLASWSPDAITRVDATTFAQFNMGWTVSNPADIDFDYVNNRICIPNTGTNTVTLEEVDDCATGITAVTNTIGISVAPNPATNSIRITGAANNASYRIFDLRSRVVRSGSLDTSTSIDISALFPGAYFLRLNNAAESIRFVIVH